MRRRTVLGLGAMGGLAGTLRALPSWAEVSAAPAGFPPDFLWGVSTSAYQVEGAATVDGRGSSIWDDFSRVPGKVVGGDSGDVACDHYHRYGEDVNLIADGGMTAYRFSIAWPRILSDGTGAVNLRGLDFYDRLADALLARGVEPWACLYHWDLPSALQTRGGWGNRDIADWFTDYALIVARRLGDRVGRWAMLNEPSVHAIFGHGVGGHAPGLTGRAACVAALHHQNLAQGRAIAALRAEGGGRWSLGTVLSLQPAHAVADVPGAEGAARMWDALWNRSCLDPLFKGRYPDLLADDFAPLVSSGDMAEINQPVDFLGVNYYSPMWQQPVAEGLVGTGFGPAPTGTGVTGMGWPIAPAGLVSQLMELRDAYGNPPVYVTENGADFPDRAGPDGVVDDPERIAFIRDHLAAGAAAISAGCDLRGWFVWTLLDNFEWAEGYSRRFGLVAVDRATGRRTPKASYHWYADMARGMARGEPGRGGPGRRA